MSEIADRLVGRLLSGDTKLVDEYADLYFDAGTPTEVPVGINPVEPWGLWVRDPNRNRVHLARGFEQFHASLVLNDLDAWALTLFFDDPTVPVLLQPGSAITLTHGGVPVVAGPQLQWVRSWSKDGNYVTISGVSWDAWLLWTMCHPQPTHAAPPYNVDAYDVFVGFAEDACLHYVNANLGPGAVARRRVPGLTMAPSGGRGHVVLALGRWDTVLNTIKPFADASGLSFRVEEVQDDSTLLFRVTVPQDLSAEVRFARELGNIERFDYGLSAPTATYAYVGGSGAGVARPVVEVSDAAAAAKWFGRGIETFVNAQDSADTDTLKQRGASELLTQAEQMTFEITPAKGGPIGFMDTWRLGDTVGVLVDGVSTPDTIRSVDLTIGKDGVVAVPSVATPATGSALVEHDAFVAQTLRRLAQRVTDLERV